MEGPPTASFVATIVPASSVFRAESLICQSLGGRGQEIQSYAVISRSAARPHPYRANSGGFLPPVHIPTFDVILASDAARDDLLALFEGTGVSITGLNCNGNPLHPNKVIGDKHAEDIRRSIRLASRLGHNRVVTMSGLPGEESGATRPSCIVNARNSAALDVLDHQSFSGWWQTVDAFELVSTERKSQPGTFAGRASLMQGDVVALDINLEARSREG